MRQWLKERLKSVLGDLIDIALENKGAVIAFLSPAFGTLMAYLLSLYQTSRRMLLLEVMTGQITLQMWHLIAFALFLLSGIGFGLIIPKFKKKHDFLFIEELGVKWRTKSSIPRIEETPYCPKHQLKMIYNNKFYHCPDCEDLKIKEDGVLQIAREVAQNKAEAIIGDHYKRRV